MSARLAAFGLAAALLGAAMASSVFAGGGTAGRSSSVSSGSSMPSRAMPSGQWRAPVSQSRGAPATGQPRPAAAGHPHAGSVPRHFHHHHGFHRHAFVTTGIIVPTWYYPWYPWYPAAAYPYPVPYSAPPAVWYYCPAYNAYYPYVTECPSGWQTVAPGASY